MPLAFTLVPPPLPLESRASTNASDTPEMETLIVLPCARERLLSDNDWPAVTVRDVSGDVGPAPGTNPWTVYAPARTFMLYTPPEPVVTWLPPLVPNALTNAPTTPAPLWVTLPVIVPKSPALAWMFCVALEVLSVTVADPRPPYPGANTHTPHVPASAKIVYEPGYGGLGSTVTLS